MEVVEVTTVNVALLQLLACRNDQGANAEKGEVACREAARMGADIAVFPEMWNVGYYEWGDAGDGVEQLRRQAISQQSGFFARFQALAKELGMAIALTYLEEWPGRPRNAVSVIDRHGEVRLTYAKVHTCDFGDEACLTPGHAFPVADLDTAAGQVRVGAMICFDLVFPETARCLMLDGAELIFVPNSSRNDGNHRLCLRARAHENMVGIALANYAAPQQTGHSIAYDAVSYAFDEEGARELDPTILEAPADEGIYLATFNLDRMRAFRAAETQGDAYRKPRTYGLLCCESVRPPFERVDSERS
jgi:N-carbamoylputrescine amidase